MNVKGKRIFVGLSGGVDSAVTAALLKEAGADVVGVFIKGWYPPNLTCTWAADRRDAMRVAARLFIPFHTLDASAAYKKSVIDYLLSEYSQGRTPNPDIMCNRDVKFGAFYSFAMEQGADAIATGHYAIAKDGHVYRGVDPEKDQSYFLWAVAKEALEKTLFPLGTYKKSEIRTLAKRFNLPVAEKKDSQGICFLGAVSVDDFLRDEFHPEPGSAVDREGKTIGTHDGAVLRTLGERVALTDAAPGPWYVVRKDIAKNLLVVSKEKMTVVQDATIRIKHTNWFTPVTNNEPLEAQYRYHGPKVSGTFHISTDTFTPTDELPEPIASGQSLVIYRDAECVGGGIIT
ncbi:MAG TPA: tRNA 2-thiouridine(34) synthase MnmA [Candidatus Paceibacterota bacterium]|nr:tRNA 2-thiouridine(34) synthase MnmA [Candidatus Paceibacterota bacterium]